MAQDQERVDRVNAQLSEVRGILHDVRMLLIEENDDVIDLRDRREIHLDGKRSSKDRPKVRSIRPR